MIKFNGAKLKLGKNEYNLLFNVNVIEELQNEFNGSINDLKKWVEDKQNIYSNVGKIIKALINEDIELRKEQGEEISQLSQKQVNRLINNINLGDCMMAITSAYLGSFLTDIEDEGENENEDPN